MKRILLIKAHPKRESFCHALADEYIKGATAASNELDLLYLVDLELQDFVNFDHATDLKLPDHLKRVQEQIKAADHLLFAFPLWWSGAPALLKLFIDSLFLSGFAFQYQKSKSKISPKWDKLLSGKSASLIVTMDTPPWYYRYVHGDPVYKMMKEALQFCGIKVRKSNYFGSVKVSSEEKRREWLKEAYKLGLNSL